MGLTCSKSEAVDPHQHDLPDPEIHRQLRESVDLTQGGHVGQHHLLFKNQHLRRKLPPPTAHFLYPTKLVTRRHPVRISEEGVSGTHIYAIRVAEGCQEQCPKLIAQSPQNGTHHVEAPSNLLQATAVDELFHPDSLAQEPNRKVADWVTISEMHKIYVADVGLSAEECEAIIAMTEQVSRGTYAAYTYAKQTLGCREFPALADIVRDPVHTIVSSILEKSDKKSLSLDDREPHMVKYDISKRERQKLDMHTDKSEWTFLISLSNGGGLDFTGGGTYFEVLDSTVHVQRGHALIFPGKLRHCGQRISTGLRFLLVGFLVDKTPKPPPPPEDMEDNTALYIHNIP